MIPPTSDLDTLAREAFGPLRRAEGLLLEALAAGDIAKVGLRRPAVASSEVSVRATFLAFVVRRSHPLPHRRLQLIGAHVEGRLDLGDAVIAGSLWFYRCHFGGAVLLDGARVAGSLTFAACRLPSLLAERCSVADDLALNAGCVVDDELRLTRARIGGDLDGARLDLRGRGDAATARRALLADGLQLGGDLRLGERLRALGEVRCIGARIGGDVHVSGHFTGPLLAGGGRGAALLLDRIEVDGSVRFDAGFGSAGRVGLRRARIGGDIDASGANFDRLGDAAWGDGPVLALDRARIEGALVLRELQTPLIGASLAGTRVGTLVDDASSWGARLVLDGFVYRRFGDDAPLDTAFRVDWLERQQSAHLQAGFRFQPWGRLIRVLRRMGHARRAGSVAMRREQRLRRAGWVGSWAPRRLRWLPRTGHACLGALVGYGHRPARLLAWTAAVWLGCAALYGVAAEQGGAAHGVPWPDASATHLLAYSLDRLLPLVDLGLRPPWALGSAWAEAARWLGRGEAVFGAFAVLLLAASLAGWLDRDRRR